MATQKKVIDCRRSARDQSAYNLYYPYPNITPLIFLLPNVTIGQFVKTGEVIGYVLEGEGVRNSVQAPMSGTITEIKTIDDQNPKGKPIHIFSMRGCQHFPRDKIQIKQENQIMANKSILQTADICAYCGEPLWFYYDNKQNQVTFRELKRSFQKFAIEEFDWKLVLNEQYTKDTQIGCTAEESYGLPEGGKVTFLYQFDKGEPNPDQVVLKYRNVICKHEKISSGMCIFCLTDVKSMKNANFRRYLFQFDQQNYDCNLILTGKSLESQAHEFRNKIIKQKKCMLILDLDNTILHSISLKKVDDEMINSIEEYAIIPPQKNSSILVERTLVKFRPNFEYFLSKIVDMFEIFIYTKGTRPYAEQICRVVRQNYAGILQGSKNFLPHRIISRDEDPNLQKKNLDCIIPKNRQIMLILDDRRDVWNHSPLCLFTRAYIFFYYVQITSDGSTKLEPVEWEKGGGTLEHKLNQFQQKCLNEIQVAEDKGNKEQAIEIMQQLQQQMLQTQKKQKQEEQKIIACLPDASLQPNPIHPPQTKQIEQIVHHRKKPDQKKNILLRSNSSPDQYLVTTLFALKQSHTLYFQRLGMEDDEQRKEGKFADLCLCFQDYKKSLLNHLAVGYISINRDYKKLGCYRRALKLGLRIAENLSQPIDILIRPNNFAAGYPQSSAELINKFYNEAVRKMKSISQIKKVPIVSQTWIDVCYEFNCCVHHRYFEPEDPYAKVIYSNQHELRHAISQSTSAVADKIREILKEGIEECTNMNTNKEDRSQ